MSEDVVPRAFMDIDFRDRTVLNIITNNGFVPLIADSKVNILLEEIWVGKNTYECDGELLDFSHMYYLLTSNFKKLPGRSVSPMELLSNHFQVTIDD